MDSFGVGGIYAECSVNLNKTLYISPLMVMTEQEYTKHYFIEGERVCTKVGGGFRYAPTDPDAVQLQFMGTSTATSVSDDLWTMTIRGVDCSGYPSARVSVKPKLRPARNDASRAESQQYFYHPDHLGSSSFVTDAAGLVEQHMQYLPFGDLFVNQQNSTYDTRYKFSAKELDNETGYAYFGARYYDSDLSVWLSVDPLSDKYPSISPYMYVAGNPLILKDPDGQKIIIYWTDNNGENHQANISNRKQLTQWQNSLTTESGEYANNVSKAFDLIDEHDQYNTVNRAIYNKKTLRIMHTEHEEVTAYREGSVNSGSRNMYWNDNNAWESPNGEKQAPVVSFYSDIIEWCVANKKSYSSENASYKQSLKNEVRTYKNNLEKFDRTYYNENYMSNDIYEPQFIESLNKAILKPEHQSKSRTTEYYDESGNDRTYRARTIESTEPL